jgi:hypothetical protein
MRHARAWRIGPLALAAAAALSACGSSPTAPGVPPVAVATGPQVLRVISGSQCVAGGRPVVVLIYARVTVARSGNEWIANASSPESGSVELRFRQSGPSLIAGSMPVQGTIKGVATHVPNLVPGPPMTDARADFGTDARTVLDGFAFAPSSLTPAAGVSGSGSGTFIATDSDGRSCAGASFMWSLAPLS